MCIARGTACASTWAQHVHVVAPEPQVNWNKGRAVEWLLKSMCEQLGLPSGVKDRNATAMPIYVRVNGWG